MRTYLLIDVSCLAHRALHTTGGLSFEGSPTGVLFGVLRDIETLTELHGPVTCVFAFDSGGPGHRGRLNPDYKANRRRELTEDEQRILHEYREQMTRLRREILPDMGYRNIRRVKGYEADDVIAYYALRLPQKYRAVIVSSDNDLWQCLRTNVNWYSPTKKQTITFASFKEEWGIFPHQWADVKAFAGCSSDGVKGIKGIGEKTAVQWVRGRLPESSKKYQQILGNLDVYNQNIELVRLPFSGLQLPKPTNDETTTQKRNCVLAELGIRGKRKTTASRRATVKGLF